MYEGIEVPNELLIVHLVYLILACMLICPLLPSQELAIINNRLFVSDKSNIKSDLSIYKARTIDAADLLNKIMVCAVFASVSV